MRHPELTCVWSCVPQRARQAGVALLLRNSAFWKVEAIQWDNPSLKLLYEHGRLAGARCYYQSGGATCEFLVYYGPAGARWNDELKRVTEQALTAIERYAVSRGPQPVQSSWKTRLSN